MRIAIVALNAYPAVVPSAGNAVGGMETFAWLLAQGLAAQSKHEVNLLVQHVSPPPSPVNGVGIVADVEPLREWRRELSRDVEVLTGFPWLRFRRFRFGLLAKIFGLALSRIFRGRPPGLDERLHRRLQALHPDLVVALGVSPSSAAVVRAAQRRTVPSLLWIRANADLDERFLTDDNYMDPNGVSSSDAKTCFQADQILCQTNWQQLRLQERVGRESQIIANPLDASRFPLGDPHPVSRSGVLWIGRYDRHHKRPHLALEIARLCPDVPFRMIINRFDPEVEEELSPQIPDNVEVVRYLPRDQMAAAFRQARVFLSTGSMSYEGFPNVLLESTASGTPIVSLEDFGEFIQRSQGGCLASSVEQAAQQIQELMSYDLIWAQLSSAGAEYVRREHPLSKCVERFCQAIQEP